MEKKDVMEQAPVFQAITEDTATAESNTFKFNMGVSIPKTSEVWKRIERMNQQQKFDGGVKSVASMMTHNAIHSWICDMDRKADETNFHRQDIELSIPVDSELWRSIQAYAKEHNFPVEHVVRTAAEGGIFKLMEENLRAMDSDVFADEGDHDEG